MKAVQQAVDGQDDAVLVLSFLQRILAGLNALLIQDEEEDGADATTMDQDEVMQGDHSSDITNPDHLIDLIARNLLRACHPSLLHLPPPRRVWTIFRKAWRNKYGDDDDDDQKLDEFPHFIDFDAGEPRPRRRVDFLRLLLRAMAPVSMDVAACLCSIILQSIQHDNALSVEASIPPFLLFAVWLPMAPHLGPMVADLFELEAYPCPLQQVYERSWPEQWLIAEAAHRLCEFFVKRGEQHATIERWWCWSALYRLRESNVDSDDMQMDHDGDDEDDDVTDEDAAEPATVEELNQPPRITFKMEDAIRWHAARAIGYVDEYAPFDFGLYLDKLGVRDELVPWVLHPSILDREIAASQHLHLHGLAALWDGETFPAPGANQVRRVVTLHPFLVHTGHGVVFHKFQSIHHTAKVDGSSGSSSRQTGGSTKLILTPTTAKNLAMIGLAMAPPDPYPKPILLCGPPGAGKSSLIRDLTRQMFANGSIHDNLLEIHVDEETDSKSLIGTYTTTDIPGEFVWRPGALTLAVRSGKWVLLEDIDRVPVEIQAALSKLFEERWLPLGSGDKEYCHPNFRLFGTLTTMSASSAGGRRSQPVALGGKRILNPTRWKHVPVDPLTFEELTEIAKALFPDIPPFIVDAGMAVFRALDRSGRLDNVTAKPESIERAHSAGPTFDMGRHPSVRDFFKLLSRISHNITFERNTSYATEAQRTFCLAESVDVFALGWPRRDDRVQFIRTLAAPVWGITPELALRYIETRGPTLILGTEYTEIGRARIPCTRITDNAKASSATFARTNQALRYMESIAASISENEPLLLVGETGCGKTTLVQQLAKLSDRELVVQNLSLQTDSTDLLGGYRPVNISRIARQVYQDFVDIFVATFSRNQNSDFLTFTTMALGKSQWKKLSQCFRRAAAMGLKKLRDRSHKTQLGDDESNSLDAWIQFEQTAERFERQRVACDSGIAFTFTEGALVEAIRTGKWILLDEINLAAAETLQRLCGLLDDASGSVTLTERGDAIAIRRHPRFRLLAAMNPATDAGKKDLPQAIRARFTELYVDELVDPLELKAIASNYLDGTHIENSGHSETGETSATTVYLYLKCRDLAEKSLTDAAGHKPRYTLRTLCRALSAARNIVKLQHLPLKRALLEGFQLAFEGALDDVSANVVNQVFRSTLGVQVTKEEWDRPGRRPGGRRSDEQYVLVKPFWMIQGPREPIDWSQPSENGRSHFILTPSIEARLRKLARAVAAGPWPVLLEGPTSAGKTTLVEYLAARSGHTVVRINNHEHTDIQEYLGGYASDANGLLSFRDGLLVSALRKGHWVILDELNLAPSEVLEALNRLLDDNRELFLPDVNEIVKPHPHFRLFATQNPCGAYGGRKPLSRAFRNRFVEVHMSDIPGSEMTTILEKKCACPPSHAKVLVGVMTSLRQRRSKSSVFQGRDGLITPRDLLRWAERSGSSKLDLAREGYMLLAERLRNQDEKIVVQEEIERSLKVRLAMEDLYTGPSSRSRRMMADLREKSSGEADNSILSKIAPTKSMMRLLTIVLRCLEKKEPVLLVGDTGCGKTTVVEVLSIILGRQLKTLNCHATTETSDIIGGLRPVRGRQSIARKIFYLVRGLLSHLSNYDGIYVPPFLADPANTSPSEGITFPENAVQEMITLSRELMKSVEQSCNTQQGESSSDQRTKRRKLATISPSLAESDVLDVAHIGREIEALAKRYLALFEWVDGPLVRSMRTGGWILLDELSLAEDAVLERLNSVLEPSRTMVLAEKGDNGDSNADGDERFVKAHDDFRILATMNPGGDYGKRELSAALRSRFTEVWVSAIEDPDDVALVLRHTLASLPATMQPDRVGDRMLTYVEWFNREVCGDPTNPCSGLSLSLRDIIGWARFVAVASVDKGLNIWDAYCHGACLTHLDGLGLGTGIGMVDVAAVKLRCELFILEQVRSEGQNVDVFDPFNSPTSCRIHDGSFGMDPFWISLGNEPSTDLSFDYGAPTVRRNVQRILRAMQLPKPVLLEGSPGVGKTSVVAALALACGQKLIRINLSEQTDISDLIGTDLPSQEGEDENGNVSVESFSWCDGVLLKAIKEGHWVLLDELNLATQTVLEGLNSCLDHRASVFIPELGESFHCPPTFRVFAAQNPLAEGGGRKGLPKSFLNRFTKVYIDKLSESDLLSIVESRFPSFSQALVHSLVDFVGQTHCAIVQKRAFALFGSPWEFNLRDVFRWCELVDRNHEPDYESVGLVARDLFFQRFRTTEDRKSIQSLYRSVFGKEIPTHDPNYRVTDSSVEIGSISLPRGQAKIEKHRRFTGPELGLPATLLAPMEAIARCVSFNIPCLLVGPSSCGKTTVVKALAALCNAELVEVSLSPSSDINELLGCFEQVDSAESGRNVLTSIMALEESIKRSIPSGNSVMLEKSSEISYQLKVAIHRDQSPLGAVEWTAASKLLDMLTEVVKSYPTTEDEFSQKLSDLRGHIKMLVGKSNVPEEQGRGRFCWADGVLVRAMEHGCWLHLENVNLCPASVLDRLNPLMEQGKELLLGECGGSISESGESTHRVVKAHPEFRIILSMNPNEGEVSRAMRNRCVEISLLPPNEASEVLGTCDKVFGGRKHRSAVDALGTAWVSGLRSSNVVLDLIQSQPPASQGVSLSAGIIDASTSLCCASLRGIEVEFGSSLAPQMVWDRCCKDITKGLTLALSESTDNFGLLLPTPPVQWSLSSSPHLAHAIFDSRLLQLFTCSSLRSVEVRDLLNVAMDLCDFGQSNSLKALQDTWAALPCRRDDSVFLRNHIFTVLVSKSQNRVPLLGFLRGDEGPSTMSSRVLRRLQESNLFLFSVDRHHLIPEQEEKKEDTTWRQAVCLRRLPQLLREAAWQQRLNETSHTRSALEVSFLAQDGCREFSVTCQVTVYIYSLFQSLDSYIHFFLFSQDQTKNCALYNCLRTLVEKRDSLWVCLQESSYSPTANSFLGFDETEFIVEWMWLKKSLEETTIASATSKTKGLDELVLRLNHVVEEIDSVLIDSGKGRIQSKSLRKKLGYPVMPASATDWESIALLRRLAFSCSLQASSYSLLGDDQSDTQLQDLLESHHPALFLPNEDKMEILLALCMAHLSSTDEGQSKSTSKEVQYNAHRVGELCCRRLEDRTKAFIAQVAAMRIDPDIKTVENVMDLEQLVKLNFGRDEDAPSSDIGETILVSMAKVQSSLLYEFWCVWMERALVCEISKVALESKTVAQIREGLRALRSRVMKFLNIAVSKTYWSVADLRPYQTLLWSCESDFENDASPRRILSCLLPLMRCAAASHVWKSLFNSSSVLTSDLELPHPWREKHFSKLKQPRAACWPRDVGPLRLLQNVATEVTLALIGADSTISRSECGRRKFVTLENHNARIIQVQDIAEAFSSLEFPDRDLPPFEIQLMLRNSFEALTGFMTNDLHAQLLTLASTPDLPTSDVIATLKKIKSACSYEAFNELVDPVVVPLVLALARIWSSAERRGIDVSLAWIYVGLMQIHFVIPDSPLDPGRKPIAKAARLDRHLADLRLRTAAIALGSQFSRRDDCSDSSDLEAVLSEAENVAAKRLRQNKKSVERPKHAPPYVNLFKEISNFVKNTAGYSAVLPLAELLQESVSDKSRLHEATKRERSWQDTALAFCDRLQSHYRAFEDVTTPLLEGIRAVQNGLRFLTGHLQEGFLPGLVSFHEFLSFPSSWDRGLAQRQLTMSKDVIWESEKTRVAVTLASLARLVIHAEKFRGIVAFPYQAAASVFISSLTDGIHGSIPSFACDGDDDDEALYREQFPDHEKEFNQVLRAMEERLSGTLDDDEIPDEKPRRAETLNKQHVLLLCQLHRELFSSTYPSDATRISMFKLSYGAAYQIHQDNQRAVPLLTSGDEHGGAHVMALSLISAGCRPAGTVNESGVDFYRVANPSMAIQAALPLSRLVKRTWQLLTAFPGHSVLMAIIHVAESLQKLDVGSTPVGKYMSGMEALLRKAQEWEQHASVHVKLGASLDDARGLVARWRKLEVRSWPTLLHIREHRYVERAQLHWTRIYKLLHDDETAIFLSSVRQKSLQEGYMSQRALMHQRSPEWICRGLAVPMRKITVPLASVPSFPLKEFTRAMDTFLLTSSLGEFKERMELLKTFWFQLSQECTVIDNDNIILKARTLSSLWRHYAEYLPMISDKIDELRKPISSKLQDEVKLAKWDEQNYYSLADSTERNNRKLMKILREYDAVLDSNVSPLLENEFSYGVRTGFEASQESCTSIPSNAQMFPLFQKKTIEPKKHRLPTVSPHSSTDSFGWAASVPNIVECDNHVLKMDRYLVKMNSILEKHLTTSRSSSILGKEASAGLCENIFERIDALRKEKTPRAMKERALVDLFKTLKNHGFMSTKWSAPEEIHQMEDFLQLPAVPAESGVLVSGDDALLKSAESYFQRCVTELIRLRLEVSMIGSKDIGQRETKLMAGFCGHGIFMLTQLRTVLASLMVETEHFQDLVDNLAFSGQQLPVGQTRLLVAIAEFDEAYRSVTESLRQLRLFVASSLSLLTTGSKADFVRDSVAVMDSAVLSLEQYTLSTKTKLVTAEHVNRVFKAKHALELVEETLFKCRAECVALGCVPKDPFDVCCKAIKVALLASTSVVNAPSSIPNSRDTNKVKDFMDSASHAVQCTLLAVQAACGEARPGEGASSEDPDCDVQIWKCHSDAIKEWAGVNLMEHNKAACDVLEKLRIVHEDESIEASDRVCCAAVARRLCSLYNQVARLSAVRLSEYVGFFRHASKLQYVLLRVFRVLVSKGYCSASAAEGEGDDRDASGMTFGDDNEGTGMGEGEGKQDVTDQLESEDQLMGLKGDEQEKGTEKKEESKQLDEEEAEQGMEMEADFEGDMFDLPDKPPEKDDNDGEEEDDEAEELDRAMGDGTDPNEDVIDEKMWDDSDTENDIDEKEEKFEKGSAMDAQTLEDEMRTKDDDEKGKGDGAQDDEKKPERPEQEEGENQPQDDKVNEDTEDKYEDDHGVDVRNEDAQEGDDAMQIDEDVNLDEDDVQEDAEGENGLQEDAKDDDADGGDEFPDPTGEQTEEADLNDVDDPAPPESGTGQIDTEPDADEEANDDGLNPEQEEQHVNIAEQDDQPHQDAYGIKGRDGKDSVLDGADEAQEESGVDGTGDDDKGADMDQTGGQGSSGDSSNPTDQPEQGRDGGQQQNEEPSLSSFMKKVPNPFKNPGEANDFWHRKLKMLESSAASGTQDKDEQEALGTNEKERGKDEDANGEFEYTDQEGTTQVLGEVADEEAVELERKDETDADKPKTNDGDGAGENAETKSEEQSNRRDPKDSAQERNTTRKQNTEATDEERQRQEKDKREKMITDDSLQIDPEDNDAMSQDEKEGEELQSQDSDANSDAGDEENVQSGLRVVSDLEQLRMEDDETDVPNSHIMVVEDDDDDEHRRERIIDEEGQQHIARVRWAKIQGETHSLARRLCEKLRLVMEPLVASKLRGDYRTGKRINMKRVISYIASGYRKDKIWLRRTKPAKRNYRVLLAVDDSESMEKSGAGEMALAAMATLAVGMSQLEIGELGIASFGDDMKLLHPFHLPFTSEAGATVVENFRFDQQRTRTALCVESALLALEAASSVGGSDVASMQLVFLISDGRIERDSRTTLRRIIREMMERNILLVMIVVEGNDKSKSSGSSTGGLLQMKEVTFENGKPKVKQFIEDYPFPYYMILDDVQSLPEALGDALRQWFEMIVQLQSNSNR